MFAHEYTDYDLTSKQPTAGFTVEFDDPTDVESLEAAHEKLEESRAALIGAGVLNVVTPNAVKLSTVAQEIADSIATVKHRSELKQASINLNKALALRHITNEEYDELLLQYEIKKASFKKAQPVAVAKPWRPSDVLDSMDENSQRDHGELASNDRHDKED